MAEAAEGPGPADSTDCGRAVESPAIGSVLDAGHSPFGAFVLRAAHVDASLPLAGATPFSCDGGAATVGVLDACDDRDDDELLRWALFRGMNRAPPPLGTPSVLHACRLMFWKLTGGATAVIGKAVRGEGGCEGQGGSCCHFCASLPVLSGLGARRRRNSPKCDRQRQEQLRARSGTHASRQKAVWERCSEGEGARSRGRRGSCAVRESPCDVREALQNGAEHGSRAGEEGRRRRGPLVGLLDGWWWAVWMVEESRSRRGCGRPCLRLRR